MPIRVDPHDARLVALLEEDPIGNLAMAAVLETAEQGSIEVFVDREAGPSGVLTRGPWVRIYARDRSSLDRLAVEIPEGTGESSDEAAFAGVAAWIRHALADDMDIVWETPCWLYHLHPEAQAPAAREPDMRRLEPQHAALVNKHWDLGDGNAQDYLERRIREGPSSAVFVAGEPVSWALTHDDGQMGAMFTLSRWRRTGCARAVTAFLVGQIRAQDRTPFMYVRHDNERAWRAAESMGFVRWGDYRWFGAKRR